MWADVMVQKVKYWNVHLEAMSLHPIYSKTFFLSVSHCAPIKGKRYLDHDNFLALHEQILF